MKRGSFQDPKTACFSGLQFAMELDVDKLGHVLISDVSDWQIKDQKIISFWGVEIYPSLMKVTPFQVYVYVLPLISNYLTGSDISYKQSVPWFWADLAAALFSVLNIR